MELILSLLQQTSIYLIVAYFLTKTPLFMPLMTSPLIFRDKLLCYLLFSIFCIMGSYFGLHIEGAIANTRAMGAVLGGLIGGPMVGFAVGLTGGCIATHWVVLPILPVQYPLRLRGLLVALCTTTT